MIARSGNVLVVRADDPEYPKIAGMLASNSVRLVGERYDERGRRVVAVAAPGAMRANEGEAEKGFVRIGADYYTLALKDYDDWQEKWWREAIQNAVDAGASNVACSVQPLGGQTVTSYEVSCEDDGPGMDRETLLDRFLVLGGTTKRTGETTGGFGKAKELLILPWISWRIESRDLDVKGTGGAYEIRSARPKAGTKLTVVMPADNPTSAAAAWAFIGKCYLPRARFTVDGETARASLSPGEVLREFEGKAALSQNKRGTFEGSMLIRANGLYMFGRRVPQEVKGTLIVELLRPSVELLTANRDGFREKSLGWAMEEFAGELGADVRSALKKKKGLIRERFQGTGKFRGVSPKEAAGQIAEALADAVGGKRAGVRLTADGAQRVLGALGQMAPAGDSPETSEAGVDLRIDDQLALAMLGGLALRGQHQAESIAKQLAWQPDFFLVNEIEGWHVPKKFRPEAMTPTIAKLARLWAELCRFVLVQLGSSAEYGVGFIFSDSAMAAQLAEQNEEWFLLNPFRKPGDTAGPMWSVSDDADLMWLYASAVHEVTHLADGVRYHSESFASAMTRNVALCSGKDAQVRKIRKAVVARAPRRPGAVAEARPPSAAGKLEAALGDSEFLLLREVVAVDPYPASATAMQVLLDGYRRIVPAAPEWPSAKHTLESLHERDLVRYEDGYRATGLGVRQLGAERSRRKRVIDEMQDRAGTLEVLAALYREGKKGVVLYPVDISKLTGVSDQNVQRELYWLEGNGLVEQRAAGAWSIRLGGVFWYELEWS